MNNIAANIKALRTARGLTQDVLAAQLHVTRQAVSNWENGKSQPDIDTLKNLAQALNVTAEELIYGKKGGVSSARNPIQSRLLPEDHVGAKLKKLAGTVQIVGCLLSAVIGLCFGVLALVIIPLGVFCTYITAMLLYGVGHAAENSEKCAAYLLDAELPDDPPAKPAEAPENWICQSCGTENRGHVICCQGCGVSKLWLQNQQEA